MAAFNILGNTVYMKYITSLLVRAKKVKVGYMTSFNFFSMMEVLRWSMGKG